MLTLINKETPDIVLISEATLNRRHKVHIKNYSMLRRDRPNASQGGGMAILIKKSTVSTVRGEMRSRDDASTRVVNCRYD